MDSFDGLLDLLKQVPDPRRAEGQLYKLPNVLLFSILAVVSGANSYRGIVTFIQSNRKRLNAAFGLHWKGAPAHTALRYILQAHLYCGAVQSLRDGGCGVCLGVLALCERAIHDAAECERDDRMASRNETIMEPVA